MTPHTVAGHFGELLQGRLGPSGPLALVTLPTAAWRVAAGRKKRDAKHDPFKLDITTVTALAAQLNTKLAERG